MGYTSINGIMRICILKWPRGDLRAVQLPLPLKEPYDLKYLKNKSPCPSKGPLLFYVHAFYPLDFPIIVKFSSDFHNPS